MAVSAADITALLGGYTDLKAYYEARRGGIDAAVAAALKAIPQGTKVYYVHQGSGDDAAIGAQATPLRSIEEAVRRTPTGGEVHIYLLSDYKFTTEIYANGMNVFLRGDALENPPKLTFVWLPSADSPGKVRRVAGFHPSYFGQWHFMSLIIELPTDPVEEIQFGSLVGFLNGSAHVTPAMLAAKFSLCTFQLAAGSTKASIFGTGTSLLVVQFMSCTFPTSMKGRVASGVGGEGVDPNTVTRKIITNMTWI